MDDRAGKIIQRTISALEHEAASDCENSVPGGVEVLIRRVAGQLAGADISDRARNSLRRLDEDVRGYEGMRIERRRALVSRARKLLEAIAPESSEDSTEKPASSSMSVPGDNPPSTERPPPLCPDDAVTELTGVGPARGEALEALGIRTIGDLLLHCPTRYEDRRQVLSMRELSHGQHAVVRVTVTGAGRRSSPFRGAAAIIPAASGGAEGDLLFFGRPYMVEQISEGDQLLVIGTARIEDGRPAIAVNDFDLASEGDLDSAARIVPVYPITDGVSQNMLRGWIEQALERCPPPDDPLPERLRERRRLMSLAEAMHEMHRPSELPSASAARRRLAYEEFFALQLSIALRRLGAKALSAVSALEVEDLRERLVEALPFEPTGAQHRVIGEVLEDLAAAEPAHRLIHGEVGSGKTVIAALALAAASRAGRQSAMMAPTEILAEQHHESLRELLGPLGIEPMLLTGGAPAECRAATLEALQSGEPICAVGTHALFAESVDFADLAVVVIDEQHRFGVRQRARLSRKGERPNLLVMSATPIPRTLALTVHGDFDISVIDELPPGRRRPESELLTGGDRDDAWRFIHRRVAEGRQAYVVCPAIDPSEEMAAATETFEKLAPGPLADLRLGLVHGRMDRDERRRAMTSFHAGEIDVMVATSLIEVGVNVPNASVIVIENAERFGLAQLHQLRGRVARAGWQPHCLLLSDTDNPETIDRLAVLTRTCNGFEIAEEDLRRRGPGELDGVRQSGLPDFRIACIIADTGALVDAREDAFAIIARDPKLEKTENRSLRSLLTRARSGEPWTL